jgi:hypothetical protein
MHNAKIITVMSPQKCALPGDVDFVARYVLREQNCQQRQAGAGAFSCDRLIIVRWESLVVNGPATLLSFETWIS